MRLRLSLLCCVLAGAVTSRAEDIAVIVAKSLPIDSVTSDELAKIFRCETTEAPDHTKLMIFSRERGSPEREVILKNVYHMSDGSYNKFFMQAVFTGQLTAAPRIVPSAVAMKNLAAANPGAVTYVRASLADGTVKVLKIDGVLPGDPKYPLKTAD